MKATSLLVVLALVSSTEYFETGTFVVEAKAKGGGGGGGSGGGEIVDERRKGRDREMKVNGGALARFLCIFTLPMLVLLFVILKKLNFSFLNKKEEP